MWPLTVVTPFKLSPGVLQKRILILPIKKGTKPKKINIVNMKSKEIGHRLSKNL